jgi:hypothetical protein
MVTSEGIHSNPASKGEESVKVPQYTAAEKEIIAKHYPSMGSDVEQMLPGRTRKSIQNKAAHMGIKYEPPNAPLGEIYLEAAKRPSGYSNAELVQPGMSYKAVSTRTSQLVFEGKLFTTPKKGSQIKRYFDSQERCDKFYETYTPPNMARKPVPGHQLIAPGSLVKKPAAGGPARLPGEPDFSQAKWTYGKKPPERTYHSNTHSRFG